MKEQIINLYNKLQKENASIYREMQECYEKEDFKQAEYWKGKYAAFSFCIDELDKISNQYKADVINCDGDERKALLIDFISWYLNVFMRDKKLTKTKTPIQSIDIFLNSINSL